MNERKNPNIHCTVSQCAHHMCSENYCMLDQVHIDTLGANESVSYRSELLRLNRQRTEQECLYRSPVQASCCICEIQTVFDRQNRQFAGFCAKCLKKTPICSIMKSVTEGRKRI